MRIVKRLGRLVFVANKMFEDLVRVSDEDDVGQYYIDDIGWKI